MVWPVLYFGASPLLFAGGRRYPPYLVNGGRCPPYLLFLNLFFVA